jgi:hypothetical protein
MASYYVITNTDGDNTIEIDDGLNCWETRCFHNGEYVIHVSLADFVGNTIEDSMTVTVENFFSLTGQVTLSGLESPHGTIITISPDDQDTTTDSSGLFEILSVGGGSQTIMISRPGYDQIDTAVIMNQDYQFDLVMTLADFICGDANYDGAVNILDITYLIGYLYQDGPGPIPYEAGDANGDSTINILDITYLIAYLYQGGPTPENCFGL